MSGKLYIVGTPIGNLLDMSARAIETMKQCDFIAAEDTRVTVKLLNHFNIKKPMISYYRHNIETKGKTIIDRILSGEDCVLVSDAGMPAISDPGEELVKECANLGIDIYVVPGPSAVISALAVSGLPTGRFAFEGFLSVNKKRRIEHLESLKNEERTMVFYEAPHKLKATLHDLYTTLGDRKISIVREITKIHEEVLRFKLKDAVEYYDDKNPKGEFVLVIQGASNAIKKEYNLNDAVSMAEELIMQGKSKSESARLVSRETNIRKAEIYKQLINKK